MRAKTCIGVRAEQNDPADRARRRFLQDSTAAAVVALAAPNLLLGKLAPSSGRVIKIGFVGPRTGALARFGEGNDFVLSEIRKRISAGLMVNGMNHQIGRAHV